jgi:DNA-directed RNA polymerase subunit M/transcription elongation factor TFIIS
MPLFVTCPSCNSALRVRDEYAGKKLKCPRCSGVVAVPKKEADAEPLTPLEVADQRVEKVRPAPRVARRPAEPQTDIEQGPPARRPARRERDEEPKDRRARRPSKDYVPCPRCGSGGAKRVVWTPWGSFYGPALLTHVRCPECGYAYNGRTGGSNTLAATFFVLVPLILIAAIIFGLLLALRVIRL